jgi:hypothetical protein
MNRGGVRHDKHKVHKLEAFTPDELREIHADPDVVAFVAAEPLTEAHIAAIEAKAAKAEADAAAAAEKAAKPKG